MEIEIEKSNRLDKGEYTGEIVDVRENTNSEYDYTDIVVKEDDSELELNVSVPSRVTPETSFGKILNKFMDDDVSDRVGDSVDPEEILVGKEVEFMVIRDETERDGQTIEFSRIVKDSLEPVE